MVLVTTRALNNSMNLLNLGENESAKEKGRLLELYEQPLLYKLLLLEP